MATSPQQGRGCGSRAGVQGAAGPAGPYLGACLALGTGAEGGTVAPVLLGRDGSRQGKPGVTGRTPIALHEKGDVTERLGKCSKYLLMLSVMFEEVMA